MVRPEADPIPLTKEEIASCFNDPAWADRFPPILTTEQAAELASVPVGTVHDWSSRGLLSSFAAKRGKRLRILRDPFVAWLSEGLGKKGG